MTPARKSPRLPAADYAIICGVLAWLFAAHVAFGANTALLGAILSTGLLALAAVTILVRGEVRLSPPLAVAGALFLAVLLVGVVQLVPAPGALAHPFWQWVPGGGAVTLDKDATLRELLKLTGLAAVFSIGLFVGDSTQRTRWFFKALFVAAALYGVWAFFDFFIDPRQVFGVDRPFHRDRLSGGFLSANSAATLFGILSVVALAEVWRIFRQAEGPMDEMLNAVSRRGAIPLLAFLFCVTDLFLSASRAGASSFFAAALLFIAWEFLAAGGGGRHRKTGLVVVLAAAAAIILMFAVSGAMLSERLEFVEGDFGTRRDIFTAHWRAFTDAPWLGSGLGAFQPINNSLITIENWRVLARLGATHNFVLQWLEQAGLAGAAAMFGCVISLVVLMVRGMAHRRRARLWIRMILCASIVPVAHGMFDFGLEVPSIAAQWSLLLGVGCGLAMARRPAA